MGDKDDRIAVLHEALRDTAQANVTLLDRLILAEAVCVATKAYLDGDNGPSSTYGLLPVDKALSAWIAGKPS
jgi:hypothetical protein